MSGESSTTRVVVAGASGFVGRGFGEVFGDDYELIGLSRRPNEARRRSSDYRWRPCDLFSLRQTRRAVSGADCAVYLVHSMLPSARLSQGEFRDRELICADNFARAAGEEGIEQIVHLSEMVGRRKGVDADRLRRTGEIEAVLGAYGSAVTTLRAGFVIGPGGAATEMLFELVEQLPVMLLPTWTSSSVVPIARRDVVELIGYAIERGSDVEGSYDVGGADATTYRKMLAMVAELTGRDRRFVRVPVETPRLSTAWISSVTGQPRAVVEPLVERFRRDLEPADRKFQTMAGQRPMTTRRALREVIENREVAALSTRRKEAGVPSEVGERNLVRSVQRLPLPTGRTTRWVARSYAQWLPGFMGPLLRATVDDGTVRFWLGPVPWPLLVLVLDEGSRSDRQLFWIRGGILAARHPEARLEFRRVPGQQAVLTAIHNYRPRLPWLIYLATQARVHLFVMQTFGDYLRNIDRQPDGNNGRHSDAPEILETRTRDDDDAT